MTTATAQPAIDAAPLAKETLVQEVIERWWADRAVHPEEVVLDVTDMDFIDRECAFYVPDDRRGYDRLVQCKRVMVCMVGDRQCAVYSVAVED